MTKRQQIEQILTGMKTQDIIDLIESIGKKYRRSNSVKVNHLQMGRKVKVDNERPDLMAMK